MAGFRTARALQEHRKSPAPPVVVVAGGRASVEVGLVGLSWQAPVAR
jgi:hypothetical protein